MTENINPDAIRRLLEYNFNREYRNASIEIYGIFNWSTHPLGNRFWENQATMLGRHIGLDPIAVSALEMLLHPPAWAEPPKAEPVPLFFRPTPKRIDPSRPYKRLPDVAPPRPSKPKARP